MIISGGRGRLASHVFFGLFMLMVLPAIMVGLVAALLDRRDRPFTERFWFWSLCAVPAVLVGYAGFIWVDSPHTEPVAYVRWLLAWAVAIAPALTWMIAKLAMSRQR